MQKVKAGDLILLDSLDRLGRSYVDVTQEWRRLTNEVGCDLKVLDLEFFDSQGFKAMGDVGVCVQDMLLSLLAYVAQTEHDKHRARQREGIELAKKAGKYKGTEKKAFPPTTLAAAQTALDAGETKQKVEEILGVTRACVYNMLKDGRLK